MATCCVTRGSYDFVVGSEIGILKGVHSNQKTFVNLNKLSDAGKETEIGCLCWVNEEQREVHLGIKNGIVRTFDLEKHAYIGSAQCEGDGGKNKSRFCGLYKHNREFISCTECGTVSIWNEYGDVKARFNAGKDVRRMRYLNINDASCELAATAGKENGVKLWDLNSYEQPIFQAKNVKHDSLNLRIPILVADLQFVPDSNGKKLVSCTGMQQVHVYDTSTPQRRPVIEVKYGENPLTCITVTPNNISQVIVGNSIGKMALVDLRMKNVIRGFKHISGSVREVQCHPTEPWVVSCGTDRFLLVHHIKTGQIIKKVYLKTRPNCFLIRDHLSDSGRESDPAEKQHKDNDGSDSDNDVDDDIWHNMKVISDRNTRNGQWRNKKRKIA